jgi:branched-subunit amino acid aminotransferase/4-amino-4-deoxychorismate lyase
MAAEAEAQRRGADDAIFLADGGIVLEGPTTNVWWRRGDTLFTPALELGILAGVTRAVVIERSPYPVREGAFAVDELREADEAFTTSSVREVMAIAEVDGHAIPRGDAAERCQELLREEAE